MSNLRAPRLSIPVLFSPTCSFTSQAPLLAPPPAQPSHSSPGKFEQLSLVRVSLWLPSLGWSGSGWWRRGEGWPERLPRKNAECTCL
jgi:hypothetical protein